MKTINPSIHKPDKRTLDRREHILPVMVKSSNEVLALVSALSIATAIIFMAVWLSGLGATGLVGTIIWATGFVFLGFAVDSNGFNAIVNLGSGLSLLLVAVLQNTISADFTIISGFILAARFLPAIYRLLR